MKVTSYVIRHLHTYVHELCIPKTYPFLPYYMKIKYKQSLQKQRNRSVLIANYVINICTCSEFTIEKIHDSASDSSESLLLSNKNKSPKIQVPHNNGWSTTVVKSNVLRGKLTFRHQLQIEHNMYIQSVHSIIC